MQDFRFLTRLRLFSLSLTVEPEAAETNVLGKVVSDLQSGVTVGLNSIAGTLKYVTDYTGFSSDPALQQGNYLVLKFGSPAGTVTTVEIVGGTSGPVALDSDMNWVGRIANTSQQVKVVCKKNGETIETRTFSLTGLTLEAAG